MIVLSIEMSKSLHCVTKHCFRYNSVDSIKRFTNTAKCKASTVDYADVERHSKLSEKWWSLAGEMRALHAMNALRVQFIRDGLANVGRKETKPSCPLEGINILDVGCGGGILAEPLARIGANVIGIDASIAQITVAKEHALLDSQLFGRLSYAHSTIEEFASGESLKFDVVVASEILEHVSDKKLFLKSCSDILKPGGSMFITTLNKTVQSWLGGIVAAEYVLKMVPTGTHDWNKFIAPDETKRLLEACGCKTALIHGMIYNPLKNEWFWTPFTTINYAIHAIKRKSSL